MGWVTKNGKAVLEPDAPASPAPTAAQNTPKPVTNPNGGTGGTPLSMGSAAPALNRNNPNNVTPALPPSYVPPVSGFGGNNVIQNPTSPNSATGFDMSQPGAKEQHWAQNQDKWFSTPGTDWAMQNLDQFTTPWEGQNVNSGLMGTIAQPGQFQDYWAGVQGGMNTPTGAEQAISGGYQGPNNAQTAFNAMQGRIPGSFQSQWDAYYDRMAEKNMGNVNAQSAARGSYGSNAALNGAIGAGLDAEALRAKDSAQFMLDDSANQRSWMDSYSTAGRNADLSGQSQFQSNLDAAKYGLDKTKTYGDLAFNAEDLAFNKNKALSDIAFAQDDLKLKKLQTGVETGIAGDKIMTDRLTGSSREAGEAQDAFENRINSMYDRLEGFSDDVIGFLQTNGNQFINDDGSINEQGLEAAIAAAADERGYSDQQREVLRRDVKDAVDAVMKNQNPAAAAGGTTAGGTTAGGKT